MHGICPSPNWWTTLVESRNGPLQVWILGRWPRSRRNRYDSALSGGGRWEWNAGEINQRTYGMEGFPNQDLFVQVFFVKGPVTCICRYLFDPVCLVDVESFTGCIGLCLSRWVLKRLLLGKMSSMWPWRRQKFCWCVPGRNFPLYKMGLYWL